jgi:hypothetical protein
MVMRLVLRRQTTDEAVGMLVWRFPAVSPPQLVRFHVVCLAPPLAPDLVAPRSSKSQPWPA